MATNMELFDMCRGIADELFDIAEGNVLTDEYNKFVVADNYICHYEYPMTPVCREDNDSALDYRPMDMADWLNEQLEVSVTSTLGGVYRGAIVACTLGGPTIEVDTLTNSVNGRWGTESVSVPLDYVSSYALDELIESIWSAC